MALKGIYDRIITGLAGQQVVKKVDVPGVELGIGDAEILNPIIHPYLKPMLQQNFTAKRPQAKTLDDFRTVGRGAQVKLEDFPSTPYTGEGIY